MSIIPLVQITKQDISTKGLVLRQQSLEVKDFGYEFQGIVDDLIETLMHHKIAVGLAAPQIGILLQVAVVNTSKDKTEPTLILVNPRLVSTSGKKDKKRESCMSLPYYAGEVERRSKISIIYKDRFGIDATLDAEGFLARVISHETDHLEGMLYVDRMQDLSSLEKTDIFEND